MAWPTVTIITTSMDASSDDASQARAEIKQMADNVNAIKDSKGVASGVASLDASVLLPTSQLPVVPANKGGTGQTAYTVGDILYASAAGTLTKLNAATAGYVLTSNGAGIAPSWQQAGGGLTSGTRMPFNQTAAPTGWTKDTTAGLNDSVMRIVVGTVGAGGSTAFSTFNGQAATGAYTLVEADIPSHTHLFNTSAIVGGTYDVGEVLSSNWQNPNSWAAGSITARSGFNASTGGGGAHSHPMTTSIKYNDFIIATKD